MIAKLQHIKRNVNPYGGILFCMDEIRKMGIPALIDKRFGKRVKQAKYSYSDTLLSWIYSTLCGSERLEDTKQLQIHFKDIPGSKLPSPDRIGGIFKNLATNNTYSETKVGVHEFNINKPLNELLVDTALKLKLLNQKNNYVMDLDHIIIPCEKYDAKFSYKKFEGYCPGVAFIGKLPIYIEGRNGNTHATYKMAQMVQRSLTLAKKKGIKIKTFRSDSAAYSQKVIAVLVKNNIEFFIRARHSHKMFAPAIDKNDWKTVTIGGRIQQVTSIEYNYPDGNTYRIVVTRDTNKRNYTNPYTDGHFVYRAIITNNQELSDKEVVHFYNQRGSMETNFTSLLNDWNWKRLPFSFLNQNVAFMIIGAIGSLMYQHIVRKFSKRIPFVKRSFRLKNFIFNFITVALEWILKENELIPNLYTDRDYSPLLGRPPC